MPICDVVYKPKDFLETADGLVFAVVQAGLEPVADVDKVLCFLRYVKVKQDGHSHWQKLNTSQANDYLKANYPKYLHYSNILDAHVHAIAVKQILKHHQPRERLQQLLRQVEHDQCEQDCANLCQLFIDNGLDVNDVGVTGSLLISAQKTTSDIDLVVYNRQSFQNARLLVKTLIEQNTLGSLTDADWHEAYDRRGCSLSFADYVWHEQRKCNKAIINNRKFDLGLLAVDDALAQATKPFRKQGLLKIKANVIDDTYSFDYPSVYQIDHAEIETVVCFTATYVGQAFSGETIEVSGLLEQAEDGTKRIIVGSSREAPGEYIKVIAPCRF